ncbi:MAG: hypothetical protein ACOVOR_04960, partial [Rhabdochlamydiaceae bacterium]
CVGYKGRLEFPRPFNLRYIKKINFSKYTLPSNWYRLDLTNLIKAVFPEKGDKLLQNRAKIIYKILQIPTFLIATYLSAKMVYSVAKSAFNAIGVVAPFWIKRIGTKFSIKTFSRTSASSIIGLAMIGLEMRFGFFVYNLYFYPFNKFYNLHQLSILDKITSETF